MPWERDNILLQVVDLKKYFPLYSGPFGREIGEVKAVDGISFTLKKGEILGLVGESGCGKTTVGKTILRLLPPTGGKVLVEGTDIFSLSKREFTQYRPKMQMIFQDPSNSLNPRMRVESIVAEPLTIHRGLRGKEREKEVERLLELVGLEAKSRYSYPHEFSGGEKQRIGIARALATHPRFIVADEPVSALDVSIQAQILNLLLVLQRRLGLSYLFITHDLSVVRYMSDRIAVMYLGKILEMGSNKDIYENPLHPYTRMLLEAVPIPNPRVRKKRVIPTGEAEDLQHFPSGCRFSPRCPEAKAICWNKEASLIEVERGHLVACHLFSSSSSSGNKRFFPLGE